MKFSNCRTGVTSVFETSISPVLSLIPYIRECQGAPKRRVTQNFQVPPFLSSRRSSVSILNNPILFRRRNGNFLRNFFEHLLYRHFCFAKNDAESAEMKNTNHNIRGSVMYIFTLLQAKCSLLRSNISFLKVRREGPQRRRRRPLRKFMMKFFLIKAKNLYQ